MIARPLLVPRREGEMQARRPTGGDRILPGAGWVASASRGAVVDPPFGRAAAAPARRLFVLLALLGAAAGAVAADPNRLSAAELNRLAPEEIADGWILLFDGQTLFGWQRQSDADWRVNDQGAIAAGGGQPGLLTTTSQFADYVLKVEFRASPHTNSGVFLRTPPKPADPKRDCYELNIADASLSPFPTGSLVERKRTSAVFPGDDAWHAYEVTAKGGAIKAILDGRPALDYGEEPAPELSPGGRGSVALRPLVGHIGLQFREGPIEFRNIKLKPLSLKSIFNGRDLSGWRVIPGHASVFSVVPATAASGEPSKPGGADGRPAADPNAAEGVLNVKLGNGAIESDGRYADFILQLDAFSNGRGLNSGIFFRAIPGEFWQGYECQVSNAMKDDDRSTPKDFGTGAIYRRQAARRVVADDFTWFTITLAAVGPHMASWVNGYPVVDWTDERKPDPNPRSGLRLEPGALQIQGHDPTTDLSFRRLRIVELPTR